MTKTVTSLAAAFVLLSIAGCTEKNPYVMKTYTPDGQKSPGECILTPYYKMSDGTYRTDSCSYRYRLEITGRMSGAEKDSTFVFLSNRKTIPFEQAWKASGLSSSTADYFKEEDAKFVGFPPPMQSGDFLCAIAVKTAARHEITVKEAAVSAPMPLAAMYSLIYD